MDAFLMTDARNNVSFWDVPVLYGESGDIQVAEVDKKPETQQEHTPRETLTAKELGVTSALRILKDEEQKRSIGLQRHKRETLPVLHVKGSFYEVGFKIGRTFSTLIREYIDNHRDVNYFLELYETQKGKEIFCSCFNAVSQFYPEYIREMRGIADGSKIPFLKLFLLHMEDVMMVASPSKEDKLPTQTGSTTLIVTNDEKQILGHVVDHAAIALGNAYLVFAKITESVPEQEFIALCIGGMLPGSTMAVNSHGMVFVADPVPVRKCNECGIPRSILCRAAVSAISMTKLSNILHCTGAGIANGLSVTASSLQLRVYQRSFRCFELGPRYPAHSQSSLAFKEIRPPKDLSYYHINKYQFLSTVQEKINKQQSNWILSKVKTLTSHDENSLGENVINILGDASINSLDLTNIFTSVESRGMVSVAVGIFDFLEETWSLYLDNPAETNPILVIPIAAKELGMVINPNLY